jgi:Tol biopolymer transport system component
VYAWSPRGALLALSDRKTVQLLDPATGGRRTVVRGRDLIVESFSPDGRALVYTHQTTRGSDADLRSDIYTVRLSDRRIRRLTHDGRSGEPVWGRGWIAYRHYSRTKWPQIGGLWFMHADGGQKHLFARGDQNPRRAHYGLGAVKFSRDGARLLACTVAEFGCSPVTIFVGSRRQHVFSLHEFPRLRGEGPSLYPGGLSKNGREVMIDIGPFDGDSGHRVYVVPFGGGRPRLLLRDGTSPSWAE